MRWKALTYQSFPNAHWFKTLFLFSLGTVLQVLSLVFLKREPLSQEKVGLLKILKWQAKWRAFDSHAVLSEEESENKRK